MLISEWRQAGNPELDTCRSDAAPGLAMRARARKQDKNVVQRGGH